MSPGKIAHIIGRIRFPRVSGDEPRRFSQLVHVFGVFPA